MKITAPTSSTKLVDVMTTDQNKTINKQRQSANEQALRIEAHGGTLWWTALGTAVVDECSSILDGDIEMINLNSSIALNEIRVTAGSGVTFNIEAL